MFELNFAMVAFGRFKHFDGSIYVKVAAIVVIHEVTVL